MFISLKNNLTMLLLSFFLSGNPLKLNQNITVKFRFQTQIIMSDLTISIFVSRIRTSKLLSLSFYIYDINHFEFQNHTPMVVIAIGPNNYHIRPSFI